MRKKIILMTQEQLPKYSEFTLETIGQSNDLHQNIINNVSVNTDNGQCINSITKKTIIKIIVILYIIMLIIMCSITDFTKNDNYSYGLKIGCVVVSCMRIYFMMISTVVEEVFVPVSLDLLISLICCGFTIGIVCSITIVFEWSLIFWIICAHINLILAMCVFVISIFISFLRWFFD